MHSETFIPQGMLICPRCHSKRVTTKDYAKTICGATGMAAGAASGLAGALKGSRTGAALGTVAGPMGTALGGVAGAIFGGLLGGLTGGIAGAQTGSLIDTHLLQNCICHQCGLHFSQPLQKGE